MLLLMSRFSMCQSDSSKLKFNSVQVGFFGGSLRTNKNNAYSDFSSFYENESDYSFYMNPDTVQQNYKYSGTSGSSGSIIEFGFTPYSSKKNKYNNRKEIIFGIGYSTFYSPSSYNYQESVTTIDTIVKYSISEITGDTILLERTPYDSINSKRERYNFFKNKIIIATEWNYRFVVKKRLSFSIGIGGRFSYLFGGWVVHSYSNSYRYKEKYSPYNQTQQTTLQQVNDRSNAKNGFGIEPYFKGKINFKLSKKDNFFNHLSLEGNTYIGGAFHKINKRKPVISELMYGVGIGLKYSW